jgi:hypothetical protein
MNQPIQFPNALPPAYLIEQGLLARAAPALDATQSLRLLLSILQLLNFRQSGPWDAQRLGRGFDDRYIDYASVAIALYVAAAGIPRELVLMAQNEYARANSRYGIGTDYDPTYKFLPERNVRNTDTGYRLFQQGWGISRAERSVR